MPDSLLQQLRNFGVYGGCALAVVASSANLGLQNDTSLRDPSYADCGITDGLFKSIYGNRTLSPDEIFIIKQWLGDYYDKCANGKGVKLSSTELRQRIEKSFGRANREVTL